MPTPAKENYLKAIYFLDQQHSKINITELSKKMGVSKPTANNMVKNLQERGWVIYKKYKPIQLTAKGRKAAALIIRKHRLTEMFLQQVMGFGWEEVHAIAEEIEHIDSQKLFDRMDEMLDYPSIDPHGSPIPDPDGKIIEKQYASLADIPPDVEVQLKALGDSSNELLLYLNRRSIRLGTRLKVIKVESFDHSMLISCNGHEPFTITQKVGNCLLVEKI